MRKVWLTFGIISIALISVPLINMTLLPSPSDDDIENSNNPSFKNAAIILHNKCVDCHSSHGRIPFYAKLPVAKKMIQQDINQGIARFNLDGKFAGNGEKFSELELARLEGVTYNNSMTPFRYRILHWDRGFSEREKQIVRKWIYEERAQRRLAAGISGPFAGEPIVPLPTSMPLAQAKVALGKQLFHDTRLSGDETMSCASCHSLKKGGTDQAVSSTGIRGQIGPINAPTVFNALYNHRQFWDGRAANLEEQAGGPVTNPLEMGADWGQVLTKLQQDSELMATFGEIYQDGLTKSNVLNAIATFEESLITPNSKFDKYLRGDKGALSEQERRGYELFKSNCIACHAGPNLGGLSFERLGLKEDYFATRARKPSEADMGLFNFTKNADDKHKFKVPTLRNIAQTYPYFHDGSAKTLEEAIAIMSTHQIGKKFAHDEIAEIASFLRTLTGEYEGHLLE